MIYRKCRFVPSTPSCITGWTHNLVYGYSGVTDPVTAEEDLIKGMNPAALPLTYDSAAVE